jgi:hypothetical protein
MLWIGICEASSIAMIGGMIGGCLMSYAHRQSNKFNMQSMETYWNADIKRLEALIARNAYKISTISVSKPVSNPSKPNKNNGYKHQRHFDQ